MARAVDLRTWLLLLVAALVAAMAASGCANAFGIDDPKFDPCAPDGCADAEAGAAPNDGGDGGIDATLDDGALDASSSDVTTAEADAPFVEPPGVRCGADGLRCTGATPVCCETLDGGATYDCVGSASACPGYPIQCATGSDCPPNDGCCHFQSAMKCEPLTITNCPAWACDPQLADSCDAGLACTAPLLNEGQASPYTACTP